ncbi:hypothetical protein FOZ62_001913 [Perkinsus olseni]|uniref:WLM domain-containing protein n=1 Tax=Perkinsus olseni TaxID=32597 RepID=A0A7J6SYS2_PEROL|nr:hypothetical protein FOZ62_001913 [Perkinsus olseni]
MPVVVPDLFVAAKSVTLQQREVPQKPVVLLPPLRVTATATTFGDYGTAQTVTDTKAPVVDTTPSVPRKRSRSQPVVRRRRRTALLCEPLELSPLPPRRPELPPEARGSAANPRWGADDDASEDTCFTAKPPVPRFPKKLNIARGIPCDVEEGLARRRSPSRKVAVSMAAAVSHRYFTFAFTKTADGRKVPLENRHRVVLKLHQLNTDVAMPIAKHFNLRYSHLSEQPPDAKKAGVTIREVSRKSKQQQQQQPETEEGSKNTGRRRRSDAASNSRVVVEKDEGPKYLNHIRVRIRPMVRPELGEPLLSDSTLMAVLFHELAHIRYMNHGLGFMRFLREVYLYATDELKIFHVGEPNELPSPWSWERRIYETGGRVSEGELLREFGRRSTEGPTQAQNLEDAPAEGENEISVTCFNSSGRC